MFICDQPCPAILPDRPASWGFDWWDHLLWDWGHIPIMNIKPCKKMRCCYRERGREWLRALTWLKQNKTTRVSPLQACLCISFRLPLSYWSIFVFFLKVSAHHFWLNVIWTLRSISNQSYYENLFAEKQETVDIGFLKMPIWSTSQISFGRIFKRSQPL